MVTEDGSVTPRVSAHDGSSPEVSRRCTVVPAELVKPPVLRVAWTSPPTPTPVWKATEWQIYVALQGLMGRCVLWKSGYMSKQLAAMMDDWNQHRTETCQTGNVCVPHMVLPICLSIWRWHVSCYWVTHCPQILVASLPSDQLLDQFAYKPTGSTTAALITITHHVTRLLESSSYVRYVFSSIILKHLTQLTTQYFFRNFYS